jgi:hypothetical protein
VNGLCASAEAGPDLVPRLVVSKTSPRTSQSFRAPPTVSGHPRPCLATLAKRRKCSAEGLTRPVRQDGAPRRRRRRGQSRRRPGTRQRARAVFPEGRRPPVRLSPIRSGRLPCHRRPSGKAGAGRFFRVFVSISGWAPDSAQGRLGALTSAPRPAPPSEIGAPRPAPPQSRLSWLPR